MALLALHGFTTDDPTQLYLREDFAQILQDFISVFLACFFPICIFPPLGIVEVDQLVYLND